MPPSQRSGSATALNPYITVSPQIGRVRSAGSEFLRSRPCGFGSSGLIRNHTTLPHSVSPPAQRKISTMAFFFSLSQRSSIEEPGAAAPGMTKPPSSKAITFQYLRIKQDRSAWSMHASSHCASGIYTAAGWCRAPNDYLTAMQALFIGQAYIDITFVTDVMPTGDDKTVARSYAVSFGGNAVTAAFCCAKLGIAPDLLASVADDWLGRMFVDMAAKYGISVHHRKVAESSLFFVMPSGTQRAIVRCRDDNYKHPYPPLHLTGCRALHVDGHQPDAAIDYARACREAGVLTSLDGGGLRSNTHELLEFIDVAVVAERLCEQMRLTPGEMLAYLRARGCRIGAVTMGGRGMLWYQGGGEDQLLPALAVPEEKIIDTNGAGDIFHGAYMYSFLANPFGMWEDHFRFARAASAHAIQYLGNEASLPSLAQINEAHARFDERREGPRLVAAQSG